MFKKTPEMIVKEHMGERYDLSKNGSDMCRQYRATNPNCHGCSAEVYCKEKTDIYMVLAQKHTGKPIN